jgi:hypothetical protein
VRTDNEPDLSSYGTGMGPEYEWLLSDHPLAQAERERRAAEFFTAEFQHEAGLEGEAARPEDEQFAGHLADLGEEVGGLAAQVEPSGDPDQQAHELADDPDEVTVARSRQDYEQFRREHGEPDYSYPAHYLGAGAAEYPPPSV